MSALIADYDNTPFWIPVGTNKDDLEWPWMPDSSYSALTGRYAWRTFVAGFGFDHMDRPYGCRQRGGWAGGPSPPPCRQLMRCFSAVAELLVGFWKNV